MLCKMGFDDDIVVKMYKKQNIVRGVVRARHIREYTNAILVRRMPSYALPPTRNTNLSLPSMDFPLPIGANRNGNDLLTAIIRNDCK